MKIGRYENSNVDNRIKSIATAILGDESLEKITRVCERYSEEEDDFREYDVYKIRSAIGIKILKKTSERETSNYKKYLQGRSFKVPAFYGSHNDGEDMWIAIESIEGDDLREMTNELAIAAADSLSEIQNTFWNCPDTERFDVYMERITRRYSFIKNDPIIGKAYALFLERQKTCPRTLSNGDFMEFNAVAASGKVYIIDWGFGGVMPYSLDIARFIAHATENRATFPFYMNDEQKKLFVDGMYERLREKPDYDQYIRDIKLAVMNEYVEFVEADEDEDHWYYEHAKALAKELLDELNA
ncbi:MAG: phosphotransferase [Butyrivibrio sp.]|nr:phosphotransferase [Butyrivibrio sp.]